MSEKKDYNIAIIGPRDAVRGFKALGFEIITAQTTEDAVEALFTIKKSNNAESGADSKYAIVYITEDLAEGISQDDYRKITADALPAVITVPSPQGASGFSLTRLSRIVERAVGSNILG